MSQPVRALRVVFVCTANVSRSSYAEHRARQLFADLGVEYSSAGIPGLVDQPMDPNIAREIEARGGSGASHRSRQITREIVDEADLLVVAARLHRNLLLQRWPDVGAKVVTFGQARRAIREGGEDDDLLVRLRDHQPRPRWREDVLDPLWIGPWSPKRCARVLDDHLRTIIPRLAKSAAR
ncbi:arsenate reductase/protein-tyrosine-phosphatase family protein [Aestuariimicrobium ganziense]|uniref:arsenate reductase/protein-tyrosine-phosphatase family protein n=1 Tax=Aestuariimicrobium ganziense TaxID=2773677 RepID=UPI0019450B1D|nr:hypothetical protein [Aestuariimicrobium ganziense]